MNNKGIALRKLGRYKEAIKCYDKALKIDPNYEPAKNNRIIEEHKFREKQFKTSPSQPETVSPKPTPTPSIDSHITIDRTIYDPTTQDFIISTPRPLPNVRNWIERSDPGMYWLVVCVNNNTDRPIDQWGIEIETPTTLAILGAGIEGSDQKFSLTTSSPKPWLINWILGIPHHLGIAIPRNGSRRVYFKLASDACGTSYSVAGKVSAEEYELPLEEKRFRFSCDQATPKTAMTTDPEAAERYAQTILQSRHSKETALGLLHSFGILLDLYRCCTLRNYDDLSEKMLLLVGALEGAKAGQGVIDRAREDYEIVRRLTPGHDSNTRVMGLCDSLVDLWINEVLKG